MSADKTRAQRLADVLSTKLGGAADDDIEDAASELLRLDASERELLEALDCLCNVSNVRCSGGSWDSARALIARTKEGRNG